MENIKLKARLCAYTKGTLPDNLVTDAPKDDILYGRKNGKWVDIRLGELGQIIKVPLNSGLTLKETEEPNIYLLTLNQEVLKELPLELLDDTTYYIIDNKPEIYINGGTAYSDGNNDIITDNQYGGIISGGSNYVLELLPINSKGEYNGN